MNATNCNVQDVCAGWGGGLGPLPRHHRVLRPRQGHLDRHRRHAQLPVLAVRRGAHHQEGPRQGEGVEEEAIAVSGAAAPSSELFIHRPVAAKHLAVTRESYGKWQLLKEHHL